MRDGVVVVTGAAGGIGAAIVTELLATGYRVVGVDRQPRQLVDERLAWVHGDVGKPGTHRLAVSAAAEIGLLEGWVNNAGRIENTPLHALSDAEAEDTLRCNLYGTLAGTRAALQSFVATGVQGSIVNVSSIHARGAFPGTPAYDATKGAIEALTRNAAVEYGHLGIRVNAIAPGAIRTAMIIDALKAADEPTRLERDFAALHPLGRLGEPHEVARAARFLLSADASFVSGAVLAVDGAAGARVYPFPPHADVPIRAAAAPAPEE
ncbi:SDR family NAD(P)-dependent oxidoreductase [Streptomyces hainanensis]|uniref:SDR family oxidoreductase n=1 Tax=Streptomyces hainanensis TaxID=402648 RepID=A0A4V2Y4I0_9ACTN|nr:SDR family oxidoreductase [Streptomyces hainanensis]TDC80495.1 SDR family oxidoreductase [Streptomyces hainanensis]